MFVPGTPVEPDDVAGFGVVDPTAMLLAASLMLAEGLEAPVGVADARARRRRGSRRKSTGRADTRSFTDAVIELLPQSRTDVEHFDEVWR